jgi:hypothetical protein
MVVVAQSVRALVCGTRGRGFESRLPPKTDIHNQGYQFFFEFSRIQKIGVFRLLLSVKIF